MGIPFAELLRHRGVNAAPAATFPSPEVSNQTPKRPDTLIRSFRAFEHSSHTVGDIVDTASGSIVKPAQVEIFPSPSRNVTVMSSAELKQIATGKRTKPSISPAA